MVDRLNPTRMPTKIATPTSEETDALLSLKGLGMAEMFQRVDWPTMIIVKGTYKAAY